MKDHLHDIVIRVAAIETARTVTMCLWTIKYFDLMADKKIIPAIHLINLGNDKTDMVKVLLA